MPGAIGLAVINGTVLVLKELTDQSGNDTAWKYLYYKTDTACTAKEVKGCEESMSRQGASECWKAGNHWRKLHGEGAFGVESWGSEAFLVGSDGWDSRQREHSEKRHGCRNV